MERKRHPFPVKKGRDTEKPGQEEASGNHPAQSFAENEILDDPGSSKLNLEYFQQGKCHLSSSNLLQYLTVPKMKNHLS